MPGITNWKMSQKVYINQIFQPIVKFWMDAYQNFILEIDGDLGHRPGKSNIVRTWKETNVLKFYFNCHSSLNLATIENYWQSVKQYFHKYLHWDDNTIKELIFEGWTHVS